MDPAEELMRSTHSLYPTCVKISMTDSVASEDICVSMPNVADLVDDFDDDYDLERDVNEITPLANLYRALHLTAPDSCVSIDSFVAASENTSTPSKRLHWGSSVDGIEVLPMYGSDDLLSPSVECDRNVTELTCANDEILLLVDGPAGDSASDSGFSDRSPRDDRALALSASSSSAASPSPSQKRGLVSPPASWPRTRQSSASASAVSAIACDEVTVLSEDEVLPEVYHVASAQVRDEYIPPRALARRQLEDNEVNFSKGCYYFMACLDSFWIL